MRENTRLDSIRSNLFYGLLDYTKNFPDFIVPRRFRMASPREGKELLESINSSMRDEPEILLYVHLPFCSSECIFCNASPQKASQEIRQKYIDNLLKELDLYCSSGMFDGKRAKGIYLGGGTPTLFSSDDLQRILGRIKSSVDLSDDCNVTCEAHPNSLFETGRLTELSDLGIHRISMGCQTFDSKVLELCKRSNSASQVAEIIREATSLGVSTNVDMMLGLPGQTLESVRKDLAILSDIAPDSIEYMRHEVVNPLAISLYRSNPELLVGNDDLFRMVYHTQEWMEDRGYEQNGRFESEKQFPYRYHWLREMPFIALGSRSRSYTKTVCYDKHGDLSLYLQLTDKGLPPIARYMMLDKKERMYRSLFLNMQIRKGLDLATFTGRFGESAIEVFSSLLKGLAEYGCITVDESAIRLSKYGRYFVEDVCCFIIDHALDECGSEGRSERMSHSSGDLVGTSSSRLRIRESG